MQNIPIILQNALKINHPDGRIEYIKSKNRHDFVAYKVNGEEGFIDGGTDYIRRTILSNYVEDFCLSSDSTMEDIHNKLLWGHYETPDLKGKFLYSPIKNLSLKHLKAILTYEKKMPHPLPIIHKHVIKSWIKKKSIKSVK